MPTLNNSDYYRLAFEHIPDGVLIIDSQDTILEVNDAWVRMHRYDSADELIGEKITIFHTAERFETQVKTFQKNCPRLVPVQFGRFICARTAQKFLSTSTVLILPKMVDPIIFPLLFVAILQKNCGWKGTVYCLLCCCGRVKLFFLHG